jgi:hypothetical protein
MHDVAVQTANFTECVLAPTGRGADIDQPVSATGRRQRPCWIGTTGFHLMRRADLRRAWSMISRSNCLWSA